MSFDFQLNVPTELKCTLFFSDESVCINQETIKVWKELSLFSEFPYEFSFFHGIDVYHPWEHVEKHAVFLLAEWKKIKVACQNLFSERKAKQALEPMKEGIALFFTTIFWMNNQPVQLMEWEQKVDEFRIKPVNLVERLTFIVQRPAFYHSFIQLSELFRELEKNYVTNIIKKSP